MIDKAMVVLVLVLSLGLGCFAHGEAIQVGGFLGTSGPGVAIDSAFIGNILEGRVLAEAETQTVLSSDLFVDEFAPPLPVFFILTLTNDSGMAIEGLDLSLGLNDGGVMDFSSDAIPTFVPGSLTLNGVPQPTLGPSLAEIATADFEPDVGLTLSFQLDFPDAASIAAGGDLALGLTARFVPEPATAALLLAPAFMILSRRRSGAVQQAERDAFAVG